MTSRTNLTTAVILFVAFFCASAPVFAADAPDSLDLPEEILNLN